MPGPPPKPVELKRRLGNPGKQRLPEPLVVLPAAALAVPEPPRGLLKFGKEAWTRFWRAGGAWLSPEADLTWLLLLCQAHDERGALRRVLRREGHFTTGSRGQLVTHPAVGQLRALEVQITRWLALGGFTPADRSRLGLAEVRRVSRLEEFFAKQRAAESRPAGR